MCAVFSTCLLDVIYCNLQFKIIDFFCQTRQQDFLFVSLFFLNVTLCFCILCTHTSIQYIFTYCTNTNIQYIYVVYIWKYSVLVKELICNCFPAYSSECNSGIEEIRIINIHICTCKNSHFALFIWGSIQFTLILNFIQILHRI
jgi:hypothetical protein